MTYGYAEDMSHLTPVTLCWHCDRMLDAAQEITGEAKPEPGAVSLCFYCGAVAIFEDDLELRPPTKEELDVMVEDDGFKSTFFQFTWGRQYVMIKDAEVSLLRDRKDPDR